MSEDKNGHAQAQPPTRNSELLASFAEYCCANPYHRFWQALRNWSGWHFVGVSNDGDFYKDTFGWEGKPPAARPAEQPAPPPRCPSCGHIFAPHEKLWCTACQLERGTEPHDHICVGCRSTISLCDGANCWGRFYVCIGCQAKHEQPSAPPQPARWGYAETTSQKIERLMNTNPAAEPSVEARQPRTLIELAIAAAKREGMEEAARLVCKHCAAGDVPSLRELPDWYYHIANLPWTWCDAGKIWAAAHPQEVEAFRAQRNVGKKQQVEQHQKFLEEQQNG